MLVVEYTEIEQASMKNISRLVQTGEAVILNEVMTWQSTSTKKQENKEDVVVKKSSAQKENKAKDYLKLSQI